MNTLSHGPQSRTAVQSALVEAFYILETGAASWEASSVKDITRRLFFEAILVHLVLVECRELSQWQAVSLPDVDESGAVVLRR